MLFGNIAMCNIAVAILHMFFDVKEVSCDLSKWRSKTDSVFHSLGDLCSLGVGNSTGVIILFIFNSFKVK